MVAVFQPSQPGNIQQVLIISDKLIFIGLLVFKRCNTIAILCAVSGADQLAPGLKIVNLQKPFSSLL
jgi:hypothetical protein